VLGSNVNPLQSIRNVKNAKAQNEETRYEKTRHEETRHEKTPKEKGRGKNVHLHFPRNLHFFLSRRYVYTVRSVQKMLNKQNAIFGSTMYYDHNLMEAGSIE